MIELVSNDNHDNYLGLLPIDQQRQAWFQVGSYKSGEKIWSCAAPNPRIKALREAYIALSLCKKPADHVIRDRELDNAIDAVLRAISCNGGIQEALNALNAQHPDENIKQILDTLKANIINDIQHTADTIRNTHEAISPKSGFAYQGAGTNADLVAIINIFNKLYKSDGSNPLITLYSKVSNDFQQDAKLTVKLQTKHTYLEGLSEQINRLMKMSRAEFNMAFAVDDKKHDAIIRQLKIHFNHLALEFSHDARYVNIQKEQTHRSFLQSRVIWNHIWKSRGHFFTNRFGYQLVNADVPTTDDPALNDKDFDKADDGSDIPYQLQYYNVNDYANEQRGKKQFIRKAMTVLLPTALVFAGIVAFGQMAIAIASLTGLTAVVIGAAALTSNFFLIGRDTKGFFKDGLKGKLFKDLSPLSKTLLGLFLGLSFVTSLVSGGFVFRALVDKVLPTLLPKLMLASLATPAGIAVIAAVTAIVTVVGMTALYFMVGAGFAQGYKGRYLLNKRIQLADGTVKEIPGVLSDWYNSAKNFFSYPRDAQGNIMYNRSVTDLLKQRDTAEAANNDAEYHRLNAKLKIEVFAFKARHVLKSIIAPVLMLVAVVASAIYTAALMKSSFDGTRRLLQLSLHLADTVALAITVQLTVGASIVNGALNGKNMFFAADVIGARLAQIGAKLTSIVANTALAIRHPSHALIAIQTGWKAFKENPSKTIWPAITAFFQGFIITLVALNGHGNAKELAGEGTIYGSDFGGWLPDTSSWFQLDGYTVTYFASLFGSVSLNFMASIVDTFKTWTPYLSLTRDAGDGDSPSEASELVLAPVPAGPSPTSYMSLNARLNPKSEPQSWFHFGSDSEGSIELGEEGSYRSPLLDTPAKVQTGRAAGEDQEINSSTLKQPVAVSGY